jgi:hypothetical protein
LSLITYKYVRLTDDYTPDNALLEGNETLFVTPLRPNGHALDIGRCQDGLSLDGNNGQETLDLNTMNWSNNIHYKDMRRKTQ